MTPIMYVLNWIHRYVENGVVVRDVTLIGVYDSEERAKIAIEEYRVENPAYTPYCNEDVTEWGEYEILKAPLNGFNVYVQPNNDR